MLHALPCYAGPNFEPHARQALDPSPVRRWKAVAVLRMLERRTGEDSFRSMVQVGKMGWRVRVG